MPDENSKPDSEELAPEVLPANRRGVPPVSATPRGSLKSVQTTTTVSYSGQIPPPGMLQGYEDVLPGAADRILKMAEEQAKHRQSLERGVVLGNLVNARVVAVLGTVVVLGSMVLAGFLALHGLSGQAIALVLLELVSLTGVALYRNYTKKEERVQKEKNKKQSPVKQLKPSGSTDESMPTEPQDAD
jgi:uncharacterized membrane protein